MKMTFRWFGEKQDPVPLKYIKQIPRMTGVVTSLLDMPAGENWPVERVKAMKEQVENAGLELRVIESVNIHEDIKLGLPSRDEKIENYIKTLESLQTIGIECVCYNFMPVLDWARSHLFYNLPDGSNTMYYEQNFIEGTTVDGLAERYLIDNKDYEMPGWEPERVKNLRGLVEMYSGMSEDDLFSNMKYFLDAVIPHAERLDIKLAIHPDDPPQPIFGLPKLIISRDNIRRFLNLNSSVYNGLTICTGSLGAKRENDIPAMIREFGGEGRVHFTHIRNLKYTNNTDFYESAHPDGSLDMYAIIKALHDIGFEGYARPDHGRMIWGETGRPGYGLYDRALGAAYLSGLWEAVCREAE